MSDYAGAASRAARKGGSARLSGTSVTTGGVSRGSFSGRLLGILATAALFGLSFPPYGSPAVAWFALVPLFLALRGLGPVQALLAAWLSGLVMAWAITDFLPGAVAVYYGQGHLFGALLFIGSVTVMCCLSHMLFALWYRWPGRREGALSPLVVGAAWVVAEFVRGDLEGNPWGTVGYSQAGWLRVVQVAEWTGVYGVSFVVVAVNAALAEVVAAMVAGRRLHRSVVSLGVAAALAAGVFVYGAVRLPVVEAEAPGDVPIAVVQGNDDLGSRWHREFYGRNLEGYLRLTADAAKNRATSEDFTAKDVAASTSTGAAGEESAPVRAPALVFWPENAVTFYLADEPLYRTSISQVLAPHGMQLLTGSPHRDGVQVFNSAFVLSPDGHVTSRYDKRVLMPFAEYYPRWLTVFRRRTFDGAQEFAAGAPRPPLDTAAGRATVVTCNEALFPRTLGERVAEGGGYIVNLANDAWLGVHRYSDRVLDFVALRAIEQRRYVVRASTSGGSAVFAPSGRVLVRSQPFEAEVLHASIRSRDGLTPYGRLGDVFVALCALALAVSTIRAPIPRSGTFTGARYK